MATSAAEKPPAAPTERRMAPRHPAEAMPSITGVRLSPGGREAWLVNISCTGVLLRCATKLPPGTPVQVTLEGTFQPASIKGRVARCFVADIGRPVGLSYHIGIHFNETIPHRRPAGRKPRGRARAKGRGGGGTSSGTGVSESVVGQSS